MGSILGPFGVAVGSLWGHLGSLWGCYGAPLSAAPQIRGMGMNSPELLLLVENCPKGAETLVTRCLHSLTDKGDSGGGGGDNGGQ